MNALPSSSQATDGGAPGMERTANGRDNAHRIQASPSALASFARFVVFGGGVGFAASGAVTLVAQLMPWALANALITVVSTVLCTELHARFTFGAGRRAGWRQHLQSAGSASAAYAMTTVAMLILHVVQPSAGLLTEQAVYLGASGLAGIGRFLVLRLYVFAADRNQAADRVKNPAPLRTVSLTVSSSIPVTTSLRSLPLPRRATESTMSAFLACPRLRTVARRAATGHTYAYRTAPSGTENSGVPAEARRRPQNRRFTSAGDLVALVT